MTVFVLRSGPLLRVYDDRIDRDIPADAVALIGGWEDLALAPEDLAADPSSGTAAAIAESSLRVRWAITDTGTARFRVTSRTRLHVHLVLAVHPDVDDSERRSVALELPVGKPRQRTVPLPPTSETWFWIEDSSRPRILYGPERIGPTAGSDDQ